MQKKQEVLEKDYSGKELWGLDPYNHHHIPNQVGDPIPTGHQPPLSMKWR